MDPLVSKVFASYPPNARKRLVALRQLIFETAESMEGVGPLTETLKWGEPAYLTAASKSGTTIRIALKKKDPGRYAMYFNCQTDLVDKFRGLFADELRFEGNRALVFDVGEPVPADVLRICIAEALNYHRNKRSKR